MELVVTQLIKKIPAIFAVQRFITMFMKFESNSHPHIQFHIGLPSGLFPSGF
jgi:hypothetical protein